MNLLINRITIILFFLISLLHFTTAYAQKTNTKTNNLVYVDKQGVLRWTENKAETSEFKKPYSMEIESIWLEKSNK